MNANIVSADLPALVQLLDVIAVAKMLGVSPRHVRRLADAGKMPRSLKLGGCVRWDRATIESWIADGCRPVRAAGKAAQS